MPSTVLSALNINSFNSCKTSEVSIIMPNFTNERTEAKNKWFAQRHAANNLRAGSRVYAFNYVISTLSNTIVSSRNNSPTSSKCF